MVGNVPTLFSNYDLKGIYSADEFGLFYWCLPSKTYQLKSEKCYGGMLSKIRITGMAAANATGDKIPMFVIGKAKNPRCFKNVKFLPRIHDASKMSSFYLVATEIKEKVGWMGNCLKSCSES